MVIIMEMGSGKKCYLDPETATVPEYDEEVLNANLLPPELALGLQEVATVAHEHHGVPTDVDAFLSAVYLFQE